MRSVERSSAQTRVGAQRLYVHVARFMALHGVAVLRFECRGLADGSGPWPGIQTLAPDIDQCLRLCPGVDGVMLWGLSDGATAAMLYAVTDTRVKSLFLVNPYVDNQRQQARAMVRNYYLWRVFRAQPHRLGSAGSYRADVLGLVFF